MPVDYISHFFFLEREKQFSAFTGEKYSSLKKKMTPEPGNPEDASQWTPGKASIIIPYAPR